MSAEPEARRPIETSFSYHANYMHVFSQGDASFQEAIELWEEITRALKDSDCQRVLLEDYFDTGSRQDFEAVQFVKKLRTLSVPLNTRFAVVCHESKLERNQFIASMATQSGHYQAKIFLNKRQALAWLI